MSYCAVAVCLRPKEWLYMYEVDMEQFANPNLSGCSEMLFRGFMVRQNFYVHCLYRNPDLDKRISDCLLASMAAVMAEDVIASSLLVSELNGHHQE